ncbi:MAG: efflux RND transporter permease subunit [Brevinematia bacterium]
MDKFIGLVINKPLFVLVTTLVIFLVCSIGIFRLDIDNNILNWLFRNSEVGSINYYIRDTFENSNPMIVMVKVKDSIFTMSNLNHIKNISMEYKNLKDVGNVVSLTEVEDIKSTENEIIIEKLIPEEIRDQVELSKIKDYVMSKEVYNGSLVSKDGKSSVIIIYPLPQSKQDLVAKNIRAFTENYIRSNNLDWEVYYGGSPMILDSITRLVINDISILVPVVSLVVFFILFLSFRNIKDTILPLVTVIMASASAVGIMGYLGFVLTSFGVAIPVTLIAIGNAYGIHLINEYHEKKRLYGNPDKALPEAIKRVFLPILMSALTTFGGFLSISAGAQLIPGVSFGIISGIGVIFSFVFTLTFITALIKLFPSEKVNIGNLTEENEHAFFLFWAKFIYKNRVLISVMFLIIGLISIYYLTKINIKIDYLAYFDKNSEPYVVANEISKNFDGSFEFKIYTSGDVLDPIYLRTLQIVEEEVRFVSGGKPRPSSVVSIISYLNESMTRIPMVPETKDEVENLYFFVEGRENMNFLLTPEKTESLVSFLLPVTESSERYLIVDTAEKLLNDYQNVSIVDKEIAADNIKNLVFKMIVNRIKRAEVSVEDSKIVEFVKSISLKNNFKNYEEKFDYLSKLVQKFFDEVGVDEAKISKSDIMYSLSPLVWDKFVLPNGGYKVFEKKGVGGSVKIFTHVERTLLMNQIVSLAIIIFVVAFLNTITFRSLFDGLISLVPILLTLLIIFGIMGIMKIDMNFVTVTIASIAVGVGIDYTIHFVSRYVYEIKNCRNFEEAFYRTFSTTGKGIISNSLSVGAGFSVLLLSSIVPLRNFGFIMFLTMLVSAFLALSLLPIMLIFFKKFFIRSIKFDE